MYSRIIFITSALIFSGLAQADASNVADQIKSCNQAIVEGDASKALAYAEQVLKQDKSNHDAQLCKGRAYGGTGRLNEALAALQAAEKVSTTPLEHIVALTLIGNVQKDAGRPTEALASYRQSLAISQTEKEERFVRINLNQIGATQAASNQLDAALESYMAGSKLSANDNERADSFARIASTYSSLGKHDQAIEYQIKALLMEERGGDLSHYANAGLEMGRIYTAANEYANAEKAINKIVKLSKDQGGAYWEAKSYYYLALNKVASGDPQAAKPLLIDAKQISEEIGAQLLADEVSQEIGKLH